MVISDCTQLQELLHTSFRVPFVLVLLMQYLFSELIIVSLLPYFMLNFRIVFVNTCILFACINCSVHSRGRSQLWSARLETRYDKVIVLVKNYLFSFTAMSACCVYDGEMLSGYIQVYFFAMCLQCFDADGWMIGRVIRAIKASASHSIGILSWHLM